MRMHDMTRTCIKKHTHARTTHTHARTGTRNSTRTRTHSQKHPHTRTHARTHNMCMGTPCTCLCVLCASMFVFVCVFAHAHAHWHACVSSGVFPLTSLLGHPAVSYPASVGMLYLYNRRQSPVQHTSDNPVNTQYLPMKHNADIVKY